MNVQYFKATSCNKCRQCRGIVVYEDLIKIIVYFLIMTPSHTGTLNGSLSRPHSESSGEFSLSLDQEVWSSSGSSPVQQPTSSRSSHQSPLQLRRSMDPSTIARSPSQSKSSEVLSLQQFLDEGIDPAEVRPLTLLELMCCISERAIDERDLGLLSHTLFSFNYKNGSSVFQKICRLILFND